MKCALVQGASRGIGLGFVDALLKDASWDYVFATCRSPARAEALHGSTFAADRRLVVLELDVEEPWTIEASRSAVASATPTLDLLINVAGVLHEGSMQPEKKLAQVDASNLTKAFAVNAVGPLLVAQQFESLLVGGHRAVFASLSARVGSIGDNRLGGWYAYRGSKAAQNMFLVNLAIEWRRKSDRVIVLGLHPGTVDTDLSKPFQRRGSQRRLFTVPAAVDNLLGICADAESTDSGRLFAWDGASIPW